MVEGDVRNPDALDRAFDSGDAIDGVIHFAGLKAVSESVADPLRYWDVNLTGAVPTAVTERHNCRTLVFSSTSTVYGEPKTFPLREDTPTTPVHPYAQTKLAVEQMLQALVHRRLADRRPALLQSRWSPSQRPHWGRPVGHSKQPVPIHHAGGRRPPRQLRVFGQDYPTPDGTGIRDYLHVMDLAEAHGITLDHL